MIKINDGTLDNIEDIGRELTTDSKDLKYHSFYLLHNIDKEPLVKNKQATEIYPVIAQLFQ